jgi:hypothetical protein
VNDLTNPDTGHAGVDAVIADLRRLDGLLLEEHLAVFESAHQRLRAALGDASGDGSRTV